MVRSQFKLRPKKRLAFKDRKLILAEFDELIRLATGAGGIFRVCSLIGVGGAGKTRLLDRICEIAKDHNALPIRITLESEASGTAAAPLKAIRDQAPFDCLLFDTALARYFSASGQIHALASKSGLSSNIALKALEAGSGAPGLVALPLGFAVEVFDKVKKQTVKYLRYSRQEFEEIDKIYTDSAELLDRLPFYLGLDFERRMASATTRFVFVYDSYEKQRERTVAHHAPWLREFIGTLDDGLHVIGSREPLAWSDQDWGAICAPGYVVGQLPSKDTRNLFLEECNAPDAMIDALTELSKRVPFYIEVLIAEYLRLTATKNEVTLSDLPKSSNHAVARFISHLEEPFQRLVIALATVQFFDRTLVYSLVRGLNLTIDFVEVEDVFTYFFVEPVNARAGLFKTHDLLTDFVRGDVSTLNIRRLSLEKAAEDLLIRDPETEMGEVMLDLYAGICAGNIQTHGDRFPLLGYLLEVGYRLYDAGYWRELVQIEAEAEPTETMTDGELIKAFFAAISMRRIVSVNAGRAALGRLDTYRERLGEHVVALDIETAYLAELAGDYQWARAEIARVYCACTPFDHSRRPHYRSLLYYADFLLMDGKLTAAADKLGSVYETCDFAKQSDWAELVRHRGHTFRFSALYEDAELLYLRAMEGAQGSPAMLGKLQTNLAETRAWTNPRQAIHDAGEAILRNTVLENKIEISKAHTAIAIAEAHLGNLKKAAAHVQLAQNLAQETNYPAGILFAMQADCIIALIKHEAFNAGLDRMMKIVDKIGTYSHIVALTEQLCTVREQLPSSFAKIDWIQPQNIEQRLADLSARLKRVHTPS